MSAPTIGRRGLRWPLLAVAMACLTACGGGGGGGPKPKPSTPPVLSNLKSSPSDTAQTAGGTFSVQGTLDYSDAGGDLADLTVVVLDSSGKQLSSTSTAVQGVSGKTSGTIQGSVTIPTSNVGTFTFDVSATDAAGSVSNVLSGSFRIVAASNLAAIVTPTGQTWQTLIAAGGYLYWSEVGDKQVNRVPLAGGSVQGLGLRVRNPTSAAFVGSDLIWLDARSDNGYPCTTGGDSRVKRVLNRTTSAGATQNLATDWACGPRPTSADLMVAGGSAFWVTSTDTTYAIRATSLASATTTTLATSSNPIVALASANGNIYWLENMPGNSTAAIRSVTTGGGAVVTIASGFASNTNSLAVDATSVYYTTAGASYDADSLLAQPLAGGPPVTLATGLMTPMKLVTDGHVVAWADSIGAPPIISSHINAVPVGGGTVTTLASFSAFPEDLLLTADSAVWSSATPDAISSVPLAGGPTTTLYQGSDAPRGLFLDGSSRICWTNGNPGGLADGYDRIARLTSTTTGETLAGGISYDAPILFVTATDVLVADNYRIKRIPLSGGVIETVAVEADRSPIESLASDGSTVYWDVGAAAHAAPVSGGAITVLAPSPTGFDLGGQMRLAANGNLYWWGTDNTNYEVLSVPAAGGALTVLAQGLPRLSALAVDATSVYLRSADLRTGGGIFAVPFAGGPTAVITNSDSYPDSSLGVFDLEVDGSYVYWTESDHIARAPVTGGDPYPVVDFVPQMNMYSLPVLAFDATNVYWTEPFLQDIRKAPKP